MFSVAFAMAISYRGLELPHFPVSDGISPKCKRNAEIRARHKKGVMTAGSEMVAPGTFTATINVSRDRENALG